MTAAELVRWFRVQPWADRTAADVLSTLRRFYAWAILTSRTVENPTARLTDLPFATDRPVGTTGPLPEPVPEPWSGPIRLYSRYLFARGMAPTTIDLRDQHLRIVARAMSPTGPWGVSEDDLMEWFATRRVSNEYRRNLRQTVRGFYAWAVVAGHRDDDPAAALPKVATTDPSPHPASESAVRVAILAAAPRERLMVRLAAELGLRRGEVCKVHSADILEDGERWSLLVHGKGSRERVLPLPVGLAAALRAQPEGWLFPSDQSTTGHLSARWVGKLLGRLLPDGVTSHALRHRFATRAYELDCDVFTVQRLLGHSRPDTTQRYVATTAERLRDTVDRLAPLTATGPQPARAVG